MKQYTVHKAKCNDDKINNILNREFNDREDLEIVVSDLTYVNVAGKWHYHYICREIVGYSAGPNKDAKLVYQVFMNSSVNLKKIKIFHTYKGNEFKNKIIDEVLDIFEIERSLSKKGCPYDNAVAEASYKIIKTEFAFDRVFNSLEELQLDLRSYILWYNKKHIHITLDYMIPVEYRFANMIE